MAFACGVALDVRAIMAEQPTGFLHDSLTQLAVADADWQAKEKALQEAVQAATDARAKRAQMRSDHLAQFNTTYPEAK